MVAAKKESMNYQFQRPTIAPAPKQTTDKAKRTVLSPVVSTGLLVAFLVAVGVFIIYRASIITSANSELLTLKNEYTQTVEEQKHLRLEVARLSALTRIEQIAINEIGLKSPNPEQMIFVGSGN